MDKGKLLGFVDLHPANSECPVAMTWCAHPLYARGPSFRKPGRVRDRLSDSNPGYPVVWPWSTNCQTQRSKPDQGKASHPLEYLPDEGEEM